MAYRPAERDACGHACVGEIKRTNGATVLKCQRPRGHPGHHLANGVKWNDLGEVLEGRR